MSLQYIYSIFPSALAQIIEKYVHELRLADVMAEMKSKHATTVFGRRLLDGHADAWDKLAKENKLHLMQISGGEIGQYVTILDDDDTGINEDGFGTLWSSYTPNDRLDKWRNNPHSLKQFHHYTDEDWSNRYATKIIPSGLDDNRVTVRLMIGSIPDTPEFAAFKELEDDVFMMRYPGFIPVDIMMDSVEITQHTIPLTSEQRHCRINQRVAQQEANSLRKKNHRAKK